MMMKNIASKSNLALVRLNGLLFDKVSWVVKFLSWNTKLQTRNYKKYKFHGGYCKIGQPVLLILGFFDISFLTTYSTRAIVNCIFEPTI